MNFDNLILNGLLTGLQRFIQILLNLNFWFWQFSPQCVIECVKEFKIHSVETLIEVSRKSNVKIVTYVKQKSDQKVKRIKKKRRAPK